MDRNRRKPSFAVLFALFFLAGLTASGQESASAKVARLLEGSGLTTSKIGDDMWTIPFEGKTMKDITVMLGVGDGVLVTFALIPESKNVKFSPQVLTKLLNLNDEYDGVKVGIDKKGFVFVRIDLMIRTLDKEQLSAGIEQVAAAVDGVHAEIRSHLPKTR